MSAAILCEAETFTSEQLVDVIRTCLTEPYRYSDNLRSAAMHCPYKMTTAQWIEACDQLKVNRNTAYYAISVIRKFQREVGEIA